MRTKAGIVSGAMDFLGAVYVLLMLSICIAVAFLPMLIFVMVNADGNAWPLTLILGWLCSPAIAAAFAMCRDHPVLQQHAKDSTASQSWKALPYVLTDAGHAVIRPFVKAWHLLCFRTWKVTALFVVFWFIAFVELSMGDSIPFGAMLLPMSITLSILSIPAYAVAIKLIVDYPLAKIHAILRNAVVLSVRRIPASIPTLAVLTVYIMSALAKPFLIVPLCTGLVLFVCQADAQWQANPLAEAMEKEQ